MAPSAIINISSLFCFYVHLFTYLPHACMFANVEEHIHTQTHYNLVFYFLSVTFILYLSQFLIFVIFSDDTSSFASNGGQVSLWDQVVYCITHI